MSGMPTSGTEFASWVGRGQGRRQVSSCAAPPWQRLTRLVQVEVRAGSGYGRELQTQTQEEERRSVSFGPGMGLFRRGDSVPGLAER